MEGDSRGSHQKLSEKTKGILVLFTVPIAWGTFEPAVRLVYQYQDIPPFAFSFAYYLPAAIVLELLSRASFNRYGHKQKSLQESKDDENIVILDVDDYDKTSPTRGGIELGTYLFLGNAVQLIGLKNVASDRAAFLLQLTTIFVPLVQSLLARNFSIISVKTWFACFVALTGVALIGLDDANVGVETDLTFIDSFASQWSSSILNKLKFSVSDGYIMLGALFYSFHCVRLEKFSRETRPIDLAAAKAMTETIWSGLVVAVSLLAATFASSSNAIDPFGLARASGERIIDYISQSLPTSSDHWTDVVGATLWTSLVPVAYTILAQSYGQARVPAASANLIYTVQPVATCIIAFFLLGERLGLYGYVGGALIGVAVLLVTFDDNNN
jgi:drug/metabolite transporter (DMT)-like permease